MPKKQRMNHAQKQTQRKMRTYFSDFLVSSNKKDKAEAEAMFLKERALFRNAQKKQKIS